MAMWVVDLWSFVQYRVGAHSFHITIPSTHEILGFETLNALSFGTTGSSEKATKSESTRSMITSKLKSEMLRCGYHTHKLTIHFPEHKSTIPYPNSTAICPGNIKQ